ncbi:MAG: hypothetical protein SFU83_13765 [Meiothermus sp.]|nr:hypothetical protein [Meiothermus sp.]
MDQTVTEKAIDLIVKFWHKPATGVLAPLILGLLLLLVTASTGLIIPVRDEPLWVTILGWIIVVIPVLAVIILWIFSNRYPRAPKGKLGLVIAISVQNPEKEKQIRSDFVDRLKELLQRNNSQTQFHVMIVENHIAETIKDSKAADMLANKTNSAFVLWGYVGLRQVRRGDSRHYFSIGAIVRYRKASEDVNAEIGKDFRIVVPEKILPDLENEVIVFEATSEMLALGASYIIALASMVNGNLVYSETLLQLVQQKRNALNSRGEITSYIDNKLPIRFANLYTSWHNELVRQYTITREDGLLPELERISDHVSIFAPNHFNAHLTKAICAFKLRKDIAEARRHISKIRSLKVKDGTWLLSAAFLDAYAGNLQKARKEYSRAFAAKTKYEDSTVFTQAEEFIAQVIQEEPQKTNLWFCLGLINFFGKNDYHAAKADFQRFLDQTIESAETSKYRKEASELIKHCNQRIQQMMLVDVT